LKKEGEEDDGDSYKSSRMDLGFFLLYFYGSTMRVYAWDNEKGDYNWKDFSRNNNYIRSSNVLFNRSKTKVKKVASWKKKSIIV